ncbi:MAG: zinc ribbon domain-containing protein [Cyanobacteria bacterium SIG31]|nr:zinc ribbon domain-containing protein [Cyanobacteria bacterium SIG31]
MQCPKCKKEIENNSLKCNFCKTKVASVCKDCGNINPITALNCSNCGKILLKICDECGAANLPNSTVCRKCGKSMVIEQQNKPQSEQFVYSATMNSQQKIKAKLLEGIKNAESKIITLSGTSGLGKSLVLRYVINDLKNAKLVWLPGTCTQVTQLSPFGYFQDMLLTFFNINNFCPDTLQLKKDSLKFFKEDFPALTNSEILDLLNFFYPDILDKYENIYFNKSKMFNILKKVLMTILEKTKAIFVIDNFEYIDGMSYDFLKELLKEEIVQEKCKFIITSQTARPGMGMISSPEYLESNYLDLTIAPFTESQVSVFLKQYTDMKFNKDFAKKSYKISCGNPSILEQIVLLDDEIKRKGLTNITYNTFDDVINLRLGLLKTENVRAYRMLLAMSILGEKFYPAILEQFDSNSPTEYEAIIDKLVSLGFITPLTTLAYEFKSSDQWKIIVSVVKNDENFEEILNILYEKLSVYKQSSVALLGYIVQKLSNNDQAFDIWTLLMKQASYIGDIGLYVISQKQALKLVENKSSEFYQNVKRNIYTRVGKLLEPIDHITSFEFLQNAVMMLDDNDEPEHVELLGYLASCAMKSGNYWGAIECVERVLNNIPESQKFGHVLVKSRLITPLLRLGNYGQLINIVETEILQDIEKILSKGKGTSIISIKNLFELWIGVYFDLAEALVFQGDNRAFDVIQNIYEILDRNKTNEPTLICRVNLLLALANTIKGDIKTSVKILDDILKEYSLDNMDSFIVSRWNFIDILNKFFLQNYSTLHSELFNVAAYANNINDSFTKNMLKTLLAKMLKENNQTKKALEILEEQVAYFAKEKVATGVLLSWYLIAEIKLITSGTQFALDIATKALDIAQSPNINNYYFIALFNKQIGEIYLAKQDFESAKVYFEKSIFISKQFDLQYILVKNYIQCAKLYQELALPKSASRNEYVKQALKMFQTAKNVPIVAEHSALQKNIKQELNILTSFCKLNGILIKKESK